MFNGVLLHDDDGELPLRKNGCHVINLDKVSRMKGGGLRVQEWKEVLRHGLNLEMTFP